MTDVSGAALHDSASEALAGVGNAGRSFRDTTHDLRHQAVDKLRSFADEGKAQITGSLDGLIGVARELASKVGSGPLEGYANTAADVVERWAETVKGKSVEDMIDDTRDFASAQPVLAVGIAVAAGFAISRFLKASN